MSRVGVFTLALPRRAEWLIGRGEECHVRLDDVKASRRHAVLHIDGERVVLEELGSTNGTLAAGRRLSAGAPVALGVGDMVTIGETALVVQTAKAEEPGRLWSQDVFLEKLHAERQRAALEGTRFAVLQIRVAGGAMSDPFRSTSRREGAETSTPTALERALRRCLRADDLFASPTTGAYDVLLPNTSDAAAHEVAASIRARLAEEKIRAAIELACYPRASAPAHDRLTSPPADDERAPGGAMERLEALVQRVAAAHINVLILGETGVGKEVLARTIHARSPRAAAPMVCINCAALSPALLESELFGHERGAFTGATQAKQGLLEAADGGTVFLDEVGEMPIALQAKLLRVVEQREVVRVGALRPRPIDVRFLSATNVDLEKEIGVGRFRRDLYFRLNAVSVEIPPLRERVDEIERLARGFVLAASQRAARSAPEISPRVLGILQRHAWPGNVRELRNVMERAVVLCVGDTIEVEDLPVALFDSPPSEAPAMRDDAAAGTREVERQRVIDALDRCAGNQTRAAQLLGISRGTLVARMVDFDLPRPRKKG